MAIKNYKYKSSTTIFNELTSELDGESLNSPLLNSVTIDADNNISVDFADAPTNEQLSIVLGYLKHCNHCEMAD